MNILIDADGCPVVDLTLQIAKRFCVPVIILCDTSHQIEREGAQTLVFDINEADSGMAGSQRLLHHRQYLRPPRLRFQALVCTGDAGGTGLWQCVSMMPYAPKTGWTGDVPAKKNGQTNKIHLSIRFGGAPGSRTLAPVSRPIAFRVFEIVG